MDTKEEIKKEIRRQSALEATLKTEGGEMIMSSLKKDILASMDEISSKYKTVSHPELIAASAKLAERLSVYRVLSGSSKRKKIAQKDLEEFLKDNPEN